jgi:putative membrane protein
MSSDPGVDGAERRLHPLSFLFTLLGQLRQFALPLLVILFTGRRNALDWSDLAGLIGVGVLAFVSIAQYFTYRYRLEPDGVVIRSGVFQRSLRHIPFGRIQNVSLHQNLLHRLFGVAEVRLESAGAAKPEGQMRVLRLADAQALEQQIRRRVRSVAADARAASGAASLPPPAPGSTAEVDADGTPRIPAASPVQEETVLLRLSTGELVRHGLISNRGMLVVGAAFAALAQSGGKNMGKVMEAIGHWLTGQASALHLSIVAATIAGVVLLALALVLLRLLSVVLSLLQFHGFELSESDGRLSVVRGLATRVRASLPAHRIQAWQVSEGMLHRLFNRRSLRVDTAVIEAANEKRSLRELVPIATPGRLDELVDHLLSVRAWPIVDWNALHARAWQRKLLPPLVFLVPACVVLAWFRGPWALAGLLLVPVFVWRARHWVRHTGWSVANGLVAYRHGWLQREWRFAESSKLQSIELAQSPLDRRFGMASLRFDTAGATAFESMFAIDYLPEDTARALYADLSGRLVDTRPVVPFAPHSLALTRNA